jgi:hypothetical protein
MALDLSYTYLGQTNFLVVNVGHPADTTLDWEYLGETITPRSNETATLAVSLTCQSTATSSLTTNITMAASLQAQSALAGDSMVCDLTCASTVSPALSTSITASSPLVCTTSVSASLTTSITMTTELVAMDTFVSAIVNAILIASTVQSTASLAADLTTDIKMASGITDVSVVSVLLGTNITAAAALASQSSMTGDFSRMYAVLGAEADANADLTGGTIPFQSRMQCRSSILASLQGETITMEVLLACDSETTSALTTDIRMLAPLGCEADLSADLVAAANGASLNALLRVQSTLSIPRNPGLSTKKNVKTTFKVGSIERLRVYAHGQPAHGQTLGCGPWLREHHQRRAGVRSPLCHGLARAVHGHAQRGVQDHAG